VLNCPVWAGYRELDKVRIVAMKLEGPRPSKIQLCIPEDSHSPMDEDRITMVTAIVVCCIHCESPQFSKDQWLVKIEGSVMDLEASLLIAYGELLWANMAGGMKMRPDDKK
jgi:hypothetical protein